ncbi:hypothetical protein HY483_00055 [Candidatus Woesearchaeota archaeon]|nr:hypothetical protein [Candidatus Woesearchaeota archaeon]
MSNKTTLTIIACLALSFIGSFLLRAGMPRFRTIELLILLGGIFLSLIALLGVSVRAQWGYKFTVILLAAGIANSTAIYYWTGRYFLTYTLTLFFLTLGLVASMARVGAKDEEEAQQQEPPQTVPAETLEEEKPKRRGRTKRK